MSVKGVLYVPNVKLVNRFNEQHKFYCAPDNDKYLAYIKQELAEMRKLEPDSDWKAMVSTDTGVWRYTEW